MHTKRNVEKTTLYIPLLINTEHKTYIFEFVRGVGAGREKVIQKYQKWSSRLRVYNRRIHLVFLCENEYHMEMMAAVLKDDIDKTRLPVYFSYDELWFGIEKGKIMRLCMPDGTLKSKKFI